MAGPDGGADDWVAAPSAPAPKVVDDWVPVPASKATAPLASRETIAAPKAAPKPVAPPPPSDEGPSEAALTHPLTALASPWTDPETRLNLAGTTQGQEESLAQSKLPDVAKAGIRTLDAPMNVMGNLWESAVRGAGAGAGRVASAFGADQDSARELARDIYTLGQSEASRGMGSGVHPTAAPEIETLNRISRGEPAKPAAAPTDNGTGQPIAPQPTRATRPPMPPTTALDDWVKPAETVAPPPPSRPAGPVDYTLGQPHPEQAAVDQAATETHPEPPQPAAPEPKPLPPIPGKPDTPAYNAARDLLQTYLSKGRDAASEQFKTLTLNGRPPKQFEANIVREQFRAMVEHEQQNPGSILGEKTAEQPASTPGENPTPPPAAAPGHTQIGTNADGHPIFEDANGARSFVRNGVRVTEPVGMRPTRAGGMEAVIPTKHGPEFSPAEAAAPAPSAEPWEQVASGVQDALGKGAPLNAKGLQALAERAYGGGLAEGKVPRDELYDALELGVNRYIRSRPTEFDPKADLETAKNNAAALAALKSLVPTQTVRAGEKEAMQQFSTPPDYAYAAAWAANLRQGDRVLEPSAGTGSFVTPALNANVGPVWANDLSDRRSAMLRTLKPDAVTSENAEHIHSILPQDMRPSVVLMNPPFSATARMAGKKVTDVGANHVEEALRRLEPGGRLVAIVGDGMKPNAPSFRAFWDRIGKQYDVRANIGVEGSIYRKYGTTFPTRLLVIDKVPPSGRPPVVADGVKDAQGIMEALSNVRDDRTVRNPVEQPGAQPARPGMAPEGENGLRPNAPVSDATRPLGIGEGRPDELDQGTEPAGPRGTDRPDARPGQAPGEAAGAEPHVAPVEPGRPTVRGAGSEPVGEPAQGHDTIGSGAIGAGDGIRPDGSGERADPGVTEAPETVRATERAVTDRHDDALTDSVYEAYRPQRAVIAGAKPHPGALVQSAAMASVAPPMPKHELAIPKKLISSGALSDAQLEAVMYAGHAHDQTIPASGTDSERRRGFFIGDGTGVGKGREVAGIILDNWMHGRTKHIWVSEKKPLINDARRDWSGLGRDQREIIDHGATKAGADIPAKKGILFTTYDTLKSAEQLKSAKEDIEAGKPSKQRGKTRVQQIVDWVGKDFDGVIAFDEAHNLGNSSDTKGNRGVKKAAAKALAGVELQKSLPNARVVYVSATGATEVTNLAYADRLGLWGRGTAFANREDFVSKVSAGGIGAMELVARDMKAMGHYIARNLSYDGVEYDRLEHKLSPDQHETYDKLADAWQIVLRNFHQAMEKAGITETTGSGSTRTLNSRAKSAILSQFWGGHQRFFNQIITSMQMPTVLKGVERDMAAGRQAVLQLVNTNEAAQERALQKVEEGDELEDLDMSPRDQLLQLVDNAYPTQRHEEYIDENGSKRSRPVVDSQGNPVHDPDLIEAKERLLNELGSVRVPDGPLEMLLNHFGTDKVAEVTGRKQRVVRKPDDSGQMRTVVEKRPGQANVAEANQFQDGKKPILVFSEAGGTGRSYHADLSSDSAKARRSHYLVQGGWRADKAVQGFGRTHRTNQASAPIFHLVTTDLQGQKRFISSIARRLAQLGALTKGERRTGDQGLFGLKDNLESDEAKHALTQLYKDVAGGKVEGLGIAELENQMGLKLIEPGTGRLLQELPPMTQFLNRILSLRVDMQNRVFNEFGQRLDDTIDRAAAAGTLDTGVETYRADKIKKARDQVVYTDPQSGAETRHVQLSIMNKIRPRQFKEIEQGTATGGKRPVMFVRSAKSGKVFAVTEASSHTDADGRIIDQYRLTDPVSYQYIERRKIDDGGANWQQLGGTTAEHENAWNDQVAKIPEYANSDLHMITGAVLPIWNRLGGNPRVYRLQTDDGERMLGRVIPADSVNATLEALGAERLKVSAKPAEVATRVLDGETARLANGWKLKRSFVSGEQRLELVGPDHAYLNQLQQDGVFVERIDWKTRFFIPTGENAADVIERVTADRPITQLGREGTQTQAQEPAASRLPVRPPSEDVHEVADANFKYGKHVGDKTVPIDTLNGGAASSDAGRVAKLAEKMSGPGGHISRLIADDEGNVIEGQHRLDALRSLGEKNVPVSVVRDLSSGYDAEKIEAAVREAGTLHPSQVTGVVHHALDAAHEAGGPGRARSEYEMPAPFDKHFDAALSEMERQKNAETKEQRQPGGPRSLRAALSGDKVQLADDMIGRTIGDKVTPHEAEILNAVEKEAARIVPRASVTAMRNLHLIDRVEGDTAANIKAFGHEITGATYSNGAKRLIAWSLESLDAIGTLRHEALHYLQGRGLITGKEWAALVRKSEAEGWQDKHDIDARYTKATPEAKREEAIAEQFADWRRAPDSVPKMFKPMYERVARLMGRIADHARRILGADATAEDVMSRLASGEVGRREAAEDGPQATAAQAARRKRPVPAIPVKPPGFVTRVLGEPMERLGQGALAVVDHFMPDPVKDLWHSAQMGVNPMSLGSVRAKSAAKSFANTLRRIRWDWGRVDEWLQKNYAPEQLARMWDAADQENDIRQGRTEAASDKGLASLSDDERNTVTELEKRARAAFEHAQRLGMTKAEGQAFYTPRMIVQMTDEGAKRVGKSGGSKEGANLYTSTGQLKQRKYGLASETEAAAKAKFGEGAKIVRDIRTLGLATSKLEQAIAGRTLIEKIKQFGKDGGISTVEEGGTSAPADFFTIDHPAFKTWGPKFIQEGGHISVARDQNGNIQFEAKPLYVSREFEGPLKAVLSKSSGAVYNGLMALKGKAMSLIMYSPLMHNAVIWGKAIPADPIGLLTFQAYRDGFRAKNDPGTMREALDAGLDPVGRRYFNQDLTAIAEAPQVRPGRSWTAQLLGGATGLFDKEKGESVKRAIDRIGNVWHNTFLWDRVADLQMGLYTHIRDSEMRKGADAFTAQRVAAHFANRYAGSLPIESMSKIARQTANLALFSRSFTLGNLAAFKDMVAGLPSEVRAQILEHGGIDALNRAQGSARRKAITMLMMDVTLAHAGLWLASGAISALTGQPFQSPEQNEPGKTNRFLIGYQKDGTAIYGRLPTGKVGEDMMSWGTEPMDTLKRKLSPYGRLIYEVAANDRGFGRKLYDPYASTPAQEARNAGNIAWQAADSVAPIDMVQSAFNLARGKGDVDTNLMHTFLPWTGITVSKGAPGGPAIGDYYAAKDEHDYQVAQAMPAIREKIRDGDIDGAVKDMQDLGVPLGLQRYYLRAAASPTSHLSRRALRDFEQYATPEQRQQFETDEAHP